MGTDPSPVIKNGQIDPSIFYILGAALLHPITLHLGCCLSMSKWLIWPVKSKKVGFTVHRS